MAFRNYKLEFEFNGTDYPGISVEEGIDIKSCLSSIDGFLHLLYLKILLQIFLELILTALHLLVNQRQAKSGYFVLNFVP